MNLNPPKLKPLHIGIIAAVLALIVGGALAKFWIMPLKAENDTLATSVADLQDKGSDAKMRQAKADLKKATETANLTKAAYTNQEARYFRIGPNNRPLDLSDALLATNDLSLEQALTLGPIIENWIRGTGNRLDSAPSIPAAPADPTAVVKQDPVRLEIKGLKATGTFGSIMRMLRATPTLKRLVVVNNVTLSSGVAQDNGAGATDANGNPIALPKASPTSVSADMDITVYIFPRNGKTPGKFTLPSGADAGGGGTTAPSAPAGPPGGPGLPGGAPGGPPVPRG